jgi:hypothetical protein
LGRLKELLAEFPFAADHDCSAALSAILAATVRSSLPLAPMVHVRAHAPGSGKTYLCSVISMFASAREPAPLSMAGDNDEMGKLLLAELARAPAVVMFDNLTADIRPFEKLCTALTDIWYLEGARRKLHACCGYIHSAMDSLIALRNEGVRAADVHRIEVSLPGYIVPAVSKNNPPRTPNEARFHSQYVLALALVSEDVILPEHSDDFERFASKPEVRRLMESVKVNVDPTLSHYHFSRVKLFGAGGEVLAERENDAPKGSSRNPLSETEIWNKLRRGTSIMGGGVCLDSYIQRLRELATASHIGWILADLNESEEIRRKAIRSHQRVAGRCQLTAGAGGGTSRPQR